jgi:heme/copper-type cytochrome/quinol oxidase subunit 1
MQGVLLSLPSSLTAPEDNWESINKPSLFCRINAILAIVGGEHGEATTSNNADLLIVVCGFIVGLVSFIIFFFLRAVLVDFIDHHNPNFTGRDHELDELQSQFSFLEMGGQHIVSKVEVAGMGGVGKTQLVAKVITQLKFVSDINVATHSTLEVLLPPFSSRLRSSGVVECRNNRYVDNRLSPTPTSF